MADIFPKTIAEVKTATFLSKNHSDHMALATPNPPISPR
ncbi:hypothetical protein AG0111_0g6369 [Alternaria gaisen]|uniref:Uncharacterized protein n=1 Tax=Alternaria gaisen TaxID=167740 RepID=A0ACB6FN30_9PLEO|nr:hypothetical protein AG0111_0g6369 [Alternaria gaisen]